MFYDARPDRLERTVRECLGPQEPAKPPVRDAAPEAVGTPAAALGAIVPHAGYVYSGPVAGAVYAAVAVPSTADTASDGLHLAVAAGFRFGRRLILGRSREARPRLRLARRPRLRDRHQLQARRS